MRDTLRGLIRTGIAVISSVGIIISLAAKPAMAATTATIEAEKEYEYSFSTIGTTEYDLKFHVGSGPEGYYLLQIEGAFTIECTLYENDDSELTKWKGTNISFSEKLYEGADYIYHLSGKASSEADSKIKVSLHFLDPDSPKVVKVNSDNFPDAGFRSHVLDYYDYNGDDYLSEDEIRHIKRLNFQHYLFSDITGVKYLTSLERIVLDYYQVDHVDVSGLKNLKYLACVETQLQSLDCSGCDSLETLYAHGNKENLKEVNLKGCRNLVKANINLAGLSELDVSSCVNLEELRVGSNKNLKSIDLSNNPKLKIFYCNDSGLESLDISHNRELTKLWIEYNDIESLDLSNNPELVGIYCRDNKITFLDASNCDPLEEISCSRNPIESKIVYVPSENVAHDDNSGFKYVVLKNADWIYAGTTWQGDDQTGYKAAYKYTCDKIEGYSSVIEVDVIKTTTLPQCEKAGSIVHSAPISEKLARDGKARNEKKTKVLPATGHDWGEWKVTAKASVGKDGIETRICKNDPAHKQTRKIPAITPTPNPASLALDKKTATVVCGKTLTLKATLKGASSKITWKSSDTKIAAVDKNGKISAKMAGQVTITATAAGRSAKCVVTVLYKDVTNSKDFWYAPTNYLTAKGVVKGYDKQTLFKPANDCTRAQMVTFLYRLQGEPKVKSTTCKFKDVKKTDYFFKPVIWAVEKGITTGVSKTKFDPQGVCTRAQTVTFLWRMAKKPEPSTKKNKFPDVKKSDYFYKATLWASEKKVLAGLPDGTFNPQGKCLRRQMVTFLYKYDKFINKKG